MGKEPEFSFGDQTVADAYDSVLVPNLFEPWAARLVNEFGPWRDHCVLDLATGTGVVARLLAEHVGSAGKVIGADINGEMLKVAERRCSGSKPRVEFIESHANPLDLPGESVDKVVCQQGFQFFPDKPAAACEIFRVLRNGGRAILTSWLPVTECEFFGAICKALEAVEEQELSDMMRVPFDFMPEAEMTAALQSAGFERICVRQQQMVLSISGGASRAVEVALATPIGPKLRTLPVEKQNSFRTNLEVIASKLSEDGQTLGQMVSHVVTAEKPG